MGVMFTICINNAVPQPLNYPKQGIKRALQHEIRMNCIYSFNSYITGSTKTLHKERLFKEIFAVGCENKS